MTRILVEKREPFALDERDMFFEIRDILDVPGITGVRIFNGYDIEGVTDIETAKHAVFSETGQDIVYNISDTANESYIKEADISGAAYVYAIASAVGQYDQREDFANQLLKIMEPHSTPEVRVFKMIALYGDISEAEYAKIKTYFINPNETRELPLTATKPRVYTEPEKIEIINGFSDSDDDRLTAFADEYGLAMAPDNLKLCREHFSKENRDPTVTEMKVLDAYWSDHCRHSTFLTTLDNVYINKNKYTQGLESAMNLFEQTKSYVYGDTNRPLCLMDIATLEMKKQLKNGALNDLELSDEVNACSIIATVPAKNRPVDNELVNSKLVRDKLVDGELAGEKPTAGRPVDLIVMFKNETHNHPTEMEPFGGASTCLGGAIRDPLSGRAFSYGAIRLTGSGDPGESVNDTLPGKLPQRVITKTASEGYSSYGNGIGLALGHLNEIYDPGFKAKRMECGAIVAVAEKADIIREKPLPGDVVVLVGGRTGRDGCGGATGSSKEHDDDSLEKGGAEVQKGNQVLERNIVRLFRKPHVSRIIKKCNDFGAGGVCVAVGELADGLYIDLDKVPVKYPGLDGTELAISESQERMAVVLDPENLEKFLDEAAKENLEAVKIADVTDTGRITMTWKGEEILNIDSEFLNSGGVRQSAKVVVTAPDWSQTEDKPKDIRNTWLNNLADLNVCSKKGIANRFDSTSGGVTVFLPYGGINQQTPEQGLAMRLPLRDGETDYGTLMTVGYNPALGKSSPFHAALYAVVESVMKIAAMGGDYRKVRLSFQEYFEKLSGDESWGKPFAALMGAFLAQDELGIPAIGGKDSMSGTFKDINVPPSLISFAVAVADTTKLVSRAFKGAGNKVYLIKTDINESGVPDFGMLKENMSIVYKLAQEGKVKSASVVGMGGIAAAVSEMAFGNGIGFSFDPQFEDDLFTPQYTSMIIEVEGEPVKNCIPLGETLEKEVIEIKSVTIPLLEAQQAWEETLNSVFPVQRTEKILEPKTDNSASSAISITTAHGKRPQVLIPVFPGTNGEYEMERQFKKAGADITVTLFRTQSAQDAEDSYKELIEAINKTDILAIPSGMSAGAEPDGSGKLIAMILRHPGVKDAVNRLVNDRKGLILGIGEGFKALLKAGLIQTQSVQEKECGDIILAKNPSNVYHCILKSVRIENVESPWLTGMSGQVETIPASGRDGAIHMSGELYNEYLKKGQIAAQYINEQSPCKVEAMLSENGLVLGRLGLVEKLEKGLYANVFNASESKIFTNAVQYIKDKLEEK